MNNDRLRQRQEEMIRRQREKGSPSRKSVSTPKKTPSLSGTNDVALDLHLESIDEDTRDDDTRPQVAPDVSKIDLSQLDLSRLSPEEIAELDALLAQEEKTEFEQSLYKFFLAAWKEIEPNTPLVESWHYEYMCEWLTLIATGEFKKRFPRAQGITFNVPPQSGKTSLISIIFPTWVWAKDATRRFICASYALGISEGNSVKRRALLMSKWFQSRWGDRFQLREDQNSKREFYNDRTGQMIASSVGGTITGKHGHILVLDDPVNPEQAASDADRNTANRWFDDTFHSRAIKPDGVIVTVMQRLHEDDVTGHLMARNQPGAPETWLTIRIPLECEEDTEIVFPISGKKFIRKKGDILQQKRNTADSIAYLKSNPRLWAGQFQQRPAPAEGNIVKRSWIRFWGDPNDPNSPALPSEFNRVLQSWDCTFKGNTDSDYVSGLVAGIKKADRFLLHRVYRQMSFTQTLNAITETKNTYPDTREILIEDKANGPAVIDALKQKIGGIIPVNPQGDKKERLEIASYAVESGNWYFPHKSICPWVEEFIENLVTFPNAKHDDDADAFSQLENRVGRRGGPAAFLDAYENMLKKAQEEKDRRDGVVVEEEPSSTEPPPPGTQIPVPQKERILLAGDVPG